jgi:hypothetical protein
MQRAWTVRGRLDAATCAQHGSIDAPWLELAAGAVSPRAYLNHLLAVYGFHAPLESALAMTPRLPLVVDLRDRARTSWIVQDLLLLGLRPAKIARLPQCSSIMPFRDAEEALGWLYVVELGARHHDAVRANVAFELPMAPTSYLSAPRTDPLELETALEIVANERGALDRVITAALTAIDCHARWFASGVRLSSPNLLRAL